MTAKKRYRRIDPAKLRAAVGGGWDERISVPEKDPSVGWSRHGSRR